MNKRPGLKLALAGALRLVAPGALFAQASGLTRTVVGKGDVSVAGRNGSVRLVGVYVVEKGKPMASPAP